MPPHRPRKLDGLRQYGKGPNVMDERLRRALMAMGNKATARELAKALNMTTIEVARRLQRIGAKRIGEWTGGGKDADGRGAPSWSLTNVAEDVSA